MNNILDLIDRLRTSRSLDCKEYEALISSFGNESAAYAAKLADNERKAIYGNAVYIRGLIEVGNVCRNDCLYCGIRRSNKNCDRYTLKKDQILNCCSEGYKLGFRTFVLQGGENCIPLETICEIVSSIRNSFADCAITLSLGEYSFDEYREMKKAGADRYLLRHETASRIHYEKLHPAEMSFEHRINCLYELRELGFQVGCGFMTNSPYQTPADLARDLKFIEKFKPDMCGIGPFIPQKDTPFCGFPAGSADFCIYMLSLIRLIIPNILLPATTALATISSDGRMRALKSGANVIMPNLSPLSERRKYALYDNKVFSGKESAQELVSLESAVESIGYRIVCDRGDVKK